MARRYVGSGADDDAMRHGGAELFGNDIAARGDRHDRGPQRRHRRIAPRHAAGAVRRLDGLFEHQAVPQRAGIGHSESTR
jgi:hypothetical protein